MEEFTKEGESVGPLVVVEFTKEGEPVGPLVVEEFVAAKSRLTAFSVCRAFWYFCATKVHDRTRKEEYKTTVGAGSARPYEE